MPYLRQILTSKPQKSSQNKRSVFAKQNVSIKYFALISYIQILLAETRTLKMLNFVSKKFLKFYDRSALLHALRSQLLGKQLRGIAEAKKLSPPNLVLSDS